MAAALNKHERWTDTEVAVVDMLSVKDAAEALAGLFRALGVRIGGMAKDYSDDGIEIHWDERNGHLSLACGQEAFARFREVVREELGDLPEIPVDQVVIVEISDTRKIVDRRESPRNLALSALLVIGLFAILFPWGAGIAIILKWATR